MDLKERIETITGLDDMFKPVRVRKYIQARAMYACYTMKVLKEGLSSTTKKMGYAAHNTVLNLLRQYDEIKVLPEWKMLVDKSQPKHVSKYLTEQKIIKLEKDVKRLQKYTSLLIEAEDLGILDEIKQRIELIIKVKKQLK